jgi:hypothetical protein
MVISVGSRARALGPLVAGACLIALVATGGAAAGPYVAAPPTLATPGSSPFATCTADNPSAQQEFSTLFPNAEPEPRAAINPTNPLNIVGEYQQDRWDNGGGRGLVASVSTNGGASWHRVVVPGISRCSGGAYDRASDPWVSFSPNGHLYEISLSFDVFDSNNAILVSKSTDGGDTWGSPIAVAADDTNGLDKQSITADPYNSNYVYAVWDRFVSPPGFPTAEQGRFHARSYVEQTFFSRTTNGGQSWEPPRVAYNPGTQAGTIGSIINVLPNRDLVDGLVQFADHKAKIRGAQVAVIRSSDLGVSWSKNAIIVAPLDPTYFGPFDPDTNAPIRSGGLPDFAVDSVSGALYAVWEDDAPTAGVDAIQFSQSTDGGFNWSAPVKINLTPTTVPAPDQQAFTPTVKVASNGTIGVTYYDFRNNTSAAGLTTDAWFVHCHAACTNPANWSETHVAGPFDEEQAAFARGYFLGDYEGLVTNGTSFGAFFAQAVSRAAGNPSDVFYSTIAP